LGRAPLLGEHFLKDTRAPAEAAGLVRRLFGLLLPAKTAGEDAPWADLFMALETALHHRRAILDDARGAPNATPATIMQAVEDSERALGLGAAGATDGADGGGAHGGERDGDIRSDAFAEAIRAAPFVHITARLAKIPLTTAKGRLEAIGLGFSGNCLLCVRVLLTGSAALARHHATLELLRALRPFLPEYLHHCAVVDVTTGLVPKWGVKFSLLTAPKSDSTALPAPSALMTHLLALNLGAANFACNLHGAVARRSARDCQNLGACDPRDLYVDPTNLKEVKEFGSRLLLGIGAPTTSADGFTWDTFHDRYLEKLEVATHMNSASERLQFLELCSTQYRAALELMSKLLKSVVFGTAPGGKSMGALLPSDCEPMELLTRRVESFYRLQGLRIDNPGAFEPPGADQQTALGAYPLISTEGRWAGAAGRGHGTGKQHAALEKKLAEAVATNVKLKARLTHGGGGEADGGAGRKKGAPGKQPPFTQGQEGSCRPKGEIGSLSYTALWLDNGKNDLLVSGHVWNIRALASKFNVKIGEKDWGVLCRAGLDSNRDQVCHNPSHEAHQRTADGSLGRAHTLEGFDRDELLSEFARACTDEESKLVRRQQVGDKRRGSHEGSGNGQPSRA